MKNRSKLLIASLFAGLSLGVLGGVKFATKNNNAIQTSAGNTVYWRQATSVSDVPDGADVLFGGVSGNYFYYANKISDCDTFTTSISSTYCTNLSNNTSFLAFPGTAVSPFKAIKSGNYLNIKDTSVTSTNYLARSIEDWGGVQYCYSIDSDPKAKTNGRLGNVSIDNYGQPYVYFENTKLLFRMQTENKQVYWTNKTTASGKNYSTIFRMFIKCSSLAITFNQNGGTGGKISASSYSTKDTSQTMSISTAPTKTGYNSPSYSIERTGTTGGSAPTISGKTVTIPAGSYGAFTIKTSWKANTYSIKYDGNGASSGSMSNFARTYDDGDIALSLNSFQRTGYTFAGWSKSSTGSVEYSNGQKVKNLTSTSGATVTLYAVWTPITYGINFDKGAYGTGGTSSVDVSYGDVMPSITIPTNVGYTFGGYYTGENGTGTQYYSSTGVSSRNYDLASDTILYAKWTPNTYHVSLDSQGGTDGDATVDTIFDQPVPAVTAPTKLGHIFKGYYSELNGAGIQYINGDGSSTGIAWTTPSDNTIYGYWEPIKINITIVVNDATDPGTTSASVYYGSEMPYITPATRTGYNLLGYFDAQEGGTLIYSAEGYGHGACELLEDITIYAQWEKIVNTITFDQRGGNGGTTSMSVSYGETVQDVTLPSKQYFTFKGYYDYANGEGTQYFLEDGTPVNSTWGRTTDVTVYAYWIKTMNNFAREFLDKTDGGIYCDKSKGLDKSIQDDLLASFNSINDEDGLLAFKNTERIIGMTSGFENDIVEAKSRYCYMVEELGINDFLGLGIGPVNRSLGIKMNTLSGITKDDVPEVTTLGVLTVAGGISIGAYFLFKKKKFD